MHLKMHNCIYGPSWRQKASFKSFPFTISLLSSALSPFHGLNDVFPMGLFLHDLKAGFAPQKWMWNIFEAHRNGNCCCQGWCPRNLSWEFPSVGGTRCRWQHRNEDFEFLLLVAFMGWILKHWSNGATYAKQNPHHRESHQLKANQDQHES